MIFHNLFGRFRNVKVLIAEFGTVWLPYLIRKLDLHSVALLTQFAIREGLIKAPYAGA